MRVIDAFEEPVRTIAVSPDGRLLAAATGYQIATWDSFTGEELHRGAFANPTGQLAFGPDSNWLACALQRGPLQLDDPRNGNSIRRFGGPVSGGVAVSPEGKTIVATGSGRRGEVNLEMWELPSVRPRPGFTFWSPFTRLAFSPNGEFLAGISTNRFELRGAIGGGPIGWLGVTYIGDGYFSFSRDSQLVVFGWETDLRIMETRNGNVRPKPVTQPEARAFLDVAFLGSGHLATVDGTPVMRLWSPDSWEITRGYDWNCGGLTCVVSSADGLSGVCGTKTGKLVLFDVDE
jgi:WD40 repeat protein